MPTSGPERSEILEQRLLDKRGIAADVAPTVFARHYRCMFSGCRAASLFADRLRVAPELRAGTVVCPLCGNELEALGPRGPTAELKIITGGSERVRVTLEVGEPLVLGRQHVAGNQLALDLLAPPHEASLVSRRHVEVRLDGDGGLTIEDLGSKNGTVLERSDGATTRLTPGEPIDLGPDARVVLATQVVLERSRRRYPLSASLVDPRDDPDTETTHLLG